MIQISAITIDRFVYPYIAFIMSNYKNKIYNLEQEDMQLCYYLKLIAAIVFCKAIILWRSTISFEKEIFGEPS